MFVSRWGTIVRMHHQAAQADEPGSRPLRVATAIVLSVSLVAGIAVCLLAGSTFSLWFFLGYAIPASLLTQRRPRNAIGWVLLAIGWTLCLASLEVRASPAAIAAGNLSLGDSLVAWGSAWGAFAVFPSVLALAILFPEGALPRGRWRAVSVALLAVASLLVLLAAFRPTLEVTVGGGEASVPYRNPFALVPDTALWDVVRFGQALTWFVSGELAIAALVLLVRFLRSGGLERLRLRWLVAAVVFLAVTTGLGALLSPLLGNVAWLPVAVAYPAIPAAITVAVLRYRLYDIDTLINRTVLYGTVTVVLAALFGFANVAAQRILEALTHQRSDIVTAGLAVAAALAFTPISRRLRPLADRLLPSRALLALLFVDIVGSTQKAVELGDERWRELLGQYRSVVRRELARYGGHEVDTAGDGFFATFEHATPAVECAIALRSGVQDLGIDTRIGLHLGEVGTRGETITGVAVHAAARVMAAASAGEILMSEALRNGVPDSKLATRDRGTHELKGVPGRWRLFAIEERSRATA
jgi:class 3 adenylate cyclase